jgi:hypothetical protein
MARKEFAQKKRNVDEIADDSTSDSSDKQVNLNACLSL